MRRLVGPVGWLLICAGCSTPAAQIPRAPAVTQVARSPLKATRSETETIVAPTFFRAANPAFVDSPDSLASPPLDDSCAGPIDPLPVALQTCPVDPVLQLLSGKTDAQTCQDAASTMALMMATGTLHALRHSGGSGGTGRAHHVASDIDEVLQTDDNQSSVSKQRRPPFLFTLGWKY